MEIRILSAGKEIGPYSESQVRQYLSEGLISASDLAFTDGMSEWAPVEQLLARFAPRNAVPESEPPRSISIRAAAATRVKRGPIVLQPLAAGGDLPRRTRTGPTALTIEAPRPTTQLPPVAKFIPRDEQKISRVAVDTGPLAPAHFFERPAVETPPNAPTTPPEPEENLLAVDEPPPTPEPDVEPLELPARETPQLSYAIGYMSLVAAVLGLGLLAAAVYLVWHFSTPAPHDTQSSIAPTPMAPAVANPANPQTAADYSARGFARQVKGDLDGALADYDQALARDPHNVEALSRRALAERDKGDFDRALADYNTVLTLAPNNADAYSNRGYIRQRQGDLDGALADYTEALSRKPTSAEAFYNVGLIKVRRGDIDGGIEAFNKAVDLDPKLARVYYNRGNAKNTEGDVDGAIADYTRAIEIDPSNAMACLNRGTARLSKGDATGALADYSQAIAGDPNLAPAYRGRGQIELQQGDAGAALADCGKALELDPNDTDALFGRGLAQLGLHNLDGAETDFTSYCQLAPHAAGCDAARLYLWVIASEQNSRDKADIALANALLNNWNSAPEDLTSKIANFLVGHISEEELITDASSPDPSLEPGRFCRVWYFAGVKRLVSGDSTTALAYFQKSLATGQKDVCEYLFARTQLVSLGQTRQASSQPVPPVP